MPSVKLWESRTLRAGAVALLIGAAVFAYLHFRKSAVPANADGFTIAKVERGNVVQAITTTGQLTPKVSVEVSSQISGLITAVEVDFNSPVKKGQVLARIDPSTYEQKLQQARSFLAATRATHTLNVLNATRLKGLREADLVSQQDYDQAEALMQQSEANLLTQEAEVKNAEVDLARCTITSPIDGIVLFKQADVGKTIVSSFSAPTLFSIAQDLSHMRILAPISEVDVWAVKPGAPVTFAVDAIPGRTFRGTLAQVRNPYTPSEKQQAAGAQSSIASFDSVIEVDNEDQLLRPSLTANVSVETGRRENVLTIPNGALEVRIPGVVPPAPSGAGAGSGGKAAVVYLLPDGQRTGTPLATRILIGLTDGTVTEVLEGVKAGDTVVTGVPVKYEPPERSLFH